MKTRSLSDRASIQAAVERILPGGTFDNVISDAIVLGGDRNRVEPRSASDAVRDLGSGNRVGTTPAAQEPDLSDMHPHHSEQEADL